MLKGDESEKRKYAAILPLKIAADDKFSSNFYLGFVIDEPNYYAINVLRSIAKYKWKDRVVD